MATYDRIGLGYADRRRPDPRIEAQIHVALGEARSVLNIGAGTGSYEPADGRTVVAVEPSAVMRSQRRAGAAPCVAGVAGLLPFADGSFDVAMTVLSLHHWPDPLAGLHEMRRVSGRQVVLTFEIDVGDDLWLLDDYLPEVQQLPASKTLRPDEIIAALGGGRVEVVAVPHDCTDGFMSAYWRRPEAYLDPDVRAAISGIAQLDERLVEERMARLASDLDSGDWARRHAALLDLESIDAGYRLVVT
jgi:SAM-dependent methyltransferase